MTSADTTPTRALVLERIPALARRMMRLENDSIQEVCPIGIIDFEKWEWPQGVGLYALWKIATTLGDQALLHDVDAWFTRRLAEPLPPRNVNTTTPLLTLAHLVEQQPDPARLALCADWAAWIMNDMPRTEDGGLQHIVTGETNDGELWDDTLFMTVLFLAKMGRLLHRPDYVDEAVRQFRLHIRYLADPATGLWFHGWTFHGRHNFARALWARGNCWITAGTYEFLEIAQLDEPVRQELAAVVAAQVRTLAQLQQPSGLWHTLLDDPASYLETSAAAGFGAGILKGIRLGLLDAQYLDTGRRALAGVLAQTTPQGDVHGVSYGTGMGRDLDHYRNIPLCQMAYGQALALLLLGEALYLEESA